MIPTQCEMPPAHASYQVAQRVYEWRSSFKLAADLMLEQFFNSEENHKVFADYDVSRAWAACQLTGCKFVYAAVEGVSISRLCLAHWH